MAGVGCISPSVRCCDGSPRRRPSGRRASTRGGVTVILESGDHVLIVHRRLFEKDRGRFFVGTVEAYEAGIARVTGHSFAHDLLGGNVIAKKDCRTKVFSIASGTLIVYRLPAETDMEAIQFVNRDGELTLTDGSKVCMDLAEMPHDGHL